jgi:VanZ family protein
VFRLLKKLPGRVEWLGLALVLCIIWMGSSIPPEDFPDADIFDYDKLLHAIEYLGLGLALGFVLVRKRNLFHRDDWYLWILGPGMLWAVTDELHQAVVGRDCSGLDLLADLAGLTLAVIWLRFHRNRETRPPKGA